MKAKRWLSFSAALLLAAMPVVTIHAEGEAVSDEILSDVSQNCSSIKLQLQRTQKEDARLRVYLGSQYETISSNMMQNLNLRLVRNNLANADLSIQQTSFFSERERFKADFIGYSQEMDKLINIDCRTKPDKFYEQLQLARTKRKDVYDSTYRLRELVQKHYKAVNAYKDELYNNPTETKENQ